MSDTGAARGRPPIREMARSLTAARDEQIAKVVAMVDGLADRSAADALIAPLRPRLALLRPPRPLRLARLMFMPLDALIVPAPRWRPGQPAVPRTALAPLAEAVRAADAALVARAEALIQGRTSNDRAVILEAGGLLWPAAARALAAAPPPPAWRDSGLPDSVFGPLARAVAGVLAQAMVLDRLVDEARHGLRLADKAIDAVLAGAAAHGPDAWGMAVACLLGRLVDPAPVVARLAADLADQVNPAARARAEHMADAMLDRLDAPDPGAGLIAGSDLADAGAEVRRAALLLTALDQSGAPSARRKRVQALRMQLDASSRTRFSAGIERGFNGPLTEQIAAGGHVAVDELEAAARALRDLEGAGRKIGGAAHYDALLRRTAEQVRELQEGDSLSRADKVRMVEILAGSDLAMTLLTA